MSDLTPDEKPATPADMLDLMRSQRRRTQQWERRTYVVMLVTWAAAWVVGFGALWSAQSAGGNPWFRVGDAAAWTTFGVLMAVGIVVSIVAGIRSSAGMRGPSRLAGMLYGWSWTISMIAAGLLLGAIGRMGLPDVTASVLAPALFALLVGVLYLSGGAIWRSPVQYVLGIVMIATVIAASYAGAPTHYLLYATVGPAAMLAVAIMMARGVLPAEGQSR